MNDGSISDIECLMQRSQVHPQWQEILAEALATLKDSTTLHTLTLILRGNSIGFYGAQALATLKDSQTLHTLNLDLSGSGNSIGDAGAQALATLGRVFRQFTYRGVV